jgi:hypothetical protein
MDFTQLKEDIKEISDIASSAPEPFRNKCFEVLLSALLAEREGVDRGTDRRKDKEKDNGEDDKKDDKNKDTRTGDSLPIQSQLRVFMRKTGVTEAELSKIVLVENNEVHFIQEPHPDTNRDGQMEWSLLLALKNALLKNELEADPEEIRSKCIDAGFYDKANFSANFKSPKFKDLFKETLEGQGKSVALAAAGQTALGELVKKLASEAK